MEDKQKNKVKCRVKCQEEREKLENERDTTFDIKKILNCQVIFTIQL